MTAKRIRVVNPQNSGHQILWKLNPPLNERGEQIEHVVTSEINSPLWGDECLVFQCDENGVISSFLEIGGGKCMDAEEALETIGYNVSDDL